MQLGTFSLNNVSDGKDRVVSLQKTELSIFMELQVQHRAEWLLLAKKDAACISIRNCERISWCFPPVTQGQHLKAWQEGREIWLLAILFCLDWVKLASPFRWNSPRHLSLSFSKSNSYFIKKKKCFSKAALQNETLCSLSKKKKLLLRQ